MQSLQPMKQTNKLSYQQFIQKSLQCFDYFFGFKARGFNLMLKLQKQLELPNIVKTIETTRPA